MKAIRLKHVDKKFIINYQRDKVVGGLFSFFPGQNISTEFWALRDVNMEVDKGKVIGIVGRNGAGKSTLLNIIAGISTPTNGKVEVSGRVSCLLSLGAGFQDELTGRENIYLNSSLLGMSRKEINKKYRDIVEFSELDGFLDSPLQAYSQGMRLRLGFSVAIHMDFDILLIDEILSVGDVAFQKKCFFKIDEFRKQGKTMIITTQSLDVIERLCEEAYLLENGQIVQKGHPQKVAARYLGLLDEKSLPDTFQQRFGKLRWWTDKRFWGKKEGSKEIEITEVKSYDSRGKQTNQFRSGEGFTVKAHFVVDKEIDEPHFGLAIFREDGVYCYGPNSSFDGHKIHKLNKGKGLFSIEYKSLLLKPGQYRFSAAIWDKDELWAYDYHVGFYKFEIKGENEDNQLLNLNYKWEPDHLWQKIKAPQLKEVDSFFGVNVQKQDKGGSSDIEISSIELMDSSDNSKTSFSTGEDLKMRLRFRFLKENRDYHLWLGLFRGDDIYCHGLTKQLKEKELSLTYPKLPLLTGDYYFSIVIWQKDQKEPLLHRDKACVFKMFFLGQDHGTIYLDHSWKWKLP